MKDDLFMLLDSKDREYVTGRLLEEVRGRLMKDIVLLEAAKALPRARYSIFKLKFTSGEFDMVVYDRSTHCFEAFEIKHSRKAIPEQARYLLDEDKCRLAEHRFGTMAGKTVMYLGEGQTMNDCPTL